MPIDPPTSSLFDPLGPPVTCDTVQPAADVPDEHLPPQPSPPQGRPQRARRAPTCGTEVVVSPPFVFLPLVKNLLRPDFHVAAQNCWVKEGGAFTGEVSAEMLVNLGIPWVILGHSERRLILNETNEFVGEKVAYALSKGLKVIACVASTLEQRESGTTVEVVAAQTKAIAERVSNWADVVLAYEPVWAIGTGKVATPAQAQEVHFELRKWFHANISPEVAATIRIIYGGLFISSPPFEDIRGEERLVIVLSGSLGIWKLLESVGPCLARLS
ncbi:hypothetical protein RGQ29_014311 [Quercus rubra]|uniref:Triosephosphate isomerase, cytosolic n=1 Tax=Quercus rubra TaxID=3512 RepID=A0AAN7FKW8_QUERU|nr:hypothetical protein RGQ29_014311 [Quercus rubra]